MRPMTDLPRHFALSLLCAAALFAGAAQAQPASPRPAANAAAAPPTAALRSADFIVAVVNSEPVTNNEVRSRMQQVLANMQSQGVRPPPQDVLAREVLEALILEKAQIQAAKDTGIRVDDYAVDQAMESLARQNGVPLEALQVQLIQQGTTTAAFREDIRNQMLMQRLQDREVDARVRVSEQDIDQYLAEQAPRTSDDLDSATINLGHILIAVREGASAAEVAERQARAEAALQALQNGGDIESVAQRFSDAGAPVLGMRPTNRYPSLFVQAIANTPVGAAAGPVRSAAGFHVLQLIDKSAQGVTAVVTQNHARHILLRTSPQLGEREAAQQLLELRQRLEGGASFEALARQFSEDGSAPMGGDLGWAGPGRYVPEFEQVLNTLQPGEVSQPVVSRFGVHLIQLVERRQATLTPREQREMLRDVVRERKLEKAHATWLQEVRAQAYVEYREPPL